MEKFLHKIFYLVKPFVPRKIQILMRSFLIKQTAKRYETYWPILESAAIKPPDWVGWPDNKKFALILTHDVEHQKGYDSVLKLMQIEKELGFVSSFNFVPERDYKVEKSLLDTLKNNGFEYGVHGLYHDGKLFSSETEFLNRSRKINSYLNEWGAVGFRAPSMHHDLDLIGALDIQYDLSTFDTDPFEPQPDGVGTIFPFWVANQRHKNGGYVELPYTLPQDFTPYILLRHKSFRIWTSKVEWIARNNGMVLVNVHPDYIHFNGTATGAEEYPEQLYRNFLKYLQENYKGQYWHVLPAEAAIFIEKSQKSSSQLIEYGRKNFEKNLKKICVIVQSDYTNDPRVRREAIALVDEGYSLDVICLGYKDQPQKEMVDNLVVRRVMSFFPKNNIINYLFFSSIFFIKAFFLLNYLSIKNRYSLIQIHNMPDHLVFVTFFQRLFRVPVVLDIHDLTLELFREKWSKFLFCFMYPLLRTVEYLSFKFASHLITVTQQCADILINRGVPSHKIDLILNTPDENQFPFYKERKFKELTQRANIFYHGTLARRFGLHLVIESFPKVLNEIPDSKLFLYGVGDSDYIANLHKLVQKLHLQNNVEIPGLINYDCIDDYINKMDLGIVPYMDTPYMNLALSTKAFEYVSCGLPVCASRLEATQSVFRDCSISYFDPNDIDDISEKIISLAKNQAKQKFQVKSALEDMEKISGKVMKKRYSELINKFV